MNETEIKLQTAHIGRWTESIKLVCAIVTLISLFVASNALSYFLGGKS